MVSLDGNAVVTENMQVHANKVELHLTEEEQMRVLHQQMHEKHKGHEAMHLEMLIILILGVALSQIALIEWRRRYFRTYQIVTLVGMWLIPACFCTFQGWWRFVFIWLLFSVANFLIVRKATRQSIDGNTPRLIYKWFFLVYKVSYALGLLGYLLLFFTMLGFNMLFHLKAQECMRVSILGLFYGLYFGVLGRDLAEICTDTVAARVGYYTKTGMPLRHLEANMCAVCGNSIFDHEVTIQEKSYQLGCGHIFHEFCIRGWCIVGKKQTCPYCKEKVDLKQMISNPWERRPHVMYGHLLDWIRYMVAWQPLVLTAVQSVIYLLGLE